VRSSEREAALLFCAAVNYRPLTYLKLLEQLHRLKLVNWIPTYTTTYLNDYFFAVILITPESTSIMNKVKE
jgi:hypothetical protein